MLQWKDQERKTVEMCRYFFSGQNIVIQMDYYKKCT